MDLMSLLNFVPTQDAVYVAAACGVAAALDAWLPPTPAGSGWSGARKVLSVLGQNYRNATNAPPAPAKPQG